MSFFEKVNVNGKSGSKPNAPAQLRGNTPLANAILDMFDKWHAHKEIWDDELKAQINLMNAEIVTTNKKRLAWGKKGTRYFSPSSANSDQRELYMKITGAKRDINEEYAPHKGRWRRMGERFGEMVQDDLLFIEKHWAKEFGEKPRFVPFRIDVNGKLYPAWERFAQEIKHVEHKGFTISLLGQCDAILVDQLTGERILLEVKSKSTTSAQTGFYSMKDPKIDHVKQTILYTELYRKYNINRVVIMYGNLSKKGWNMGEEDYAKNPDIRAFEVTVTEQDREEALDYLAGVLYSVKYEDIPPLDLSKFTFNNFKQACVENLTDVEYEDLKQQVEQVKRSSLPQWQKNSYLEAWAFIEGARQ